MVRLLGLNRFGGDDAPREIIRTNPVVGDGGSGENGWLIRFFDSAFFCEWIAVSYLYKHEHPGVRDYLCNRMYTLPLTGLESYLFQICYMLVHKPSPSLDKFVIDTCSKSLRIALKVHWFLMAELEDSEDNEGIGRIQEKCQIAATLMGDWPPLIRLSTGSSSTPKGSPMLNRLLPSKQRTSPPALGLSSPVEENCSSGNMGGDCNGKLLASSEESTLFKKLMLGPKVRDAFSFRKSTEKHEEESDKDGFFRRLLRDGRDKEDEVDKDGFLRRLLSKDKNEELTSSSEGFLKKLFRDKDGKFGEEMQEDGFFRRIFKDKNEERKISEHYRHGEEGTSSQNIEQDKRESLLRKLFKEKNEEKTNSFHGSHTSEYRDNGSFDEDEKEGFFRRLLKDKTEEIKDSGFRNEEVQSTKAAEDDEKDGFFQRIFKDKNEEKGITGHANNKNEETVSTFAEDDEKNGFFHRIFKDKTEEKRFSAHSGNEEKEKLNKSIADDEKEGFFRKMFKDKNDERKDSILDRNADEERLRRFEDEMKDGFLRRIFKEKHDEKKVIRHEKNADGEKPSRSTEDDEKDGFFRRIFKDKNEERKVSGVERNVDEARLSNSNDDDGKDGFFNKIFKDKHEEIYFSGHERIEEDDKVRGSVDEIEKEGFFRRLFKDKHEDKKDERHDRKQEENHANGIFEEEESFEFLSFRRLFRIHPEDGKNASANGNPDSPSDTSLGTENFFRRLFRDRDRSIEDSEFFGSRKQIEQLRPGSPKQEMEKSSTKPPLPNHLISQIRKGTYHVSLEFVQCLCDTSYGLVDIFPIEDRKVALQESLQEINHQIFESQKSGGTLRTFVDTFLKF